MSERVNEIRVIAFHRAMCEFEESYLFFYVFMCVCLCSVRECTRCKHPLSSILDTVLVINKYG